MYVGEAMPNQLEQPGRFCKLQRRSPLTGAVAYYFAHLRLDLLKAVVVQYRHFEYASRVKKV